MILLLAFCVLCSLYLSVSLSLSVCMCVCVSFFLFFYFFVQKNWFASDFMPFICKCVCFLLKSMLRYAHIVLDISILKIVIAIHLESYRSFGWLVDRCAVPFHCHLFFIHTSAMTTKISSVHNFCCCCCFLVGVRRQFSHFGDKIWFDLFLIKYEKQKKKQQQISILIHVSHVYDLYIF